MKGDLDLDLVGRSLYDDECLKTKRSELEVAIESEDRRKERKLTSRSKRER